MGEPASGKKPNIVGMWNISALWPTTTGWDATRVARAWVVLMKRLGYTRFVGPLIIFGLPAGPHKLQITLVNANHQPLDRSVVEFVIPPRDAAPKGH